MKIHSQEHNQLVLLQNAITEALREMEKCPEDSVQDIWNESLRSWGTGLKMNHSLVLEYDKDYHDLDWSLRFSMF